VENSAPTGSLAEANDAWARARDVAREELTDGSFEMWFAEVQPRGLREGALELSVPTEFVRNRLATRHQDLLTRAVREATGEDLEVRLVVDPAARRPRGEPHPVETPSGRPEPSPPRTEFPERYTFDTFVLGPSNRFAHAAAMAVAEAPPATTYNPLFVYGGVGLGKTHLLSAIASYMVRLTPALRPKYVTSERFVTEFIRAVREGQGYQFQRRYRDVDVLLVDDIQFLAGKEETQTEFFHTFNDLHRAGHQIVIASDRPPQELSGLEDRLRSRFRSGLCVDVQPPDLETRIAILQKKAERDGLEVNDPVLHFIAQKFDSNIRELEGALVRVVAFAKLSAMPLDLSAAERALEDLIDQTGQEIPAHAIVSETARYFSLRREDLFSKSRSRPLTNARHIAMYLLRELTGLSLIKIGELFDRDHTTALHGIKRIEGLMPARDVTYRQVQDLTKLIRESVRGKR
jgi:chromosomal replication initiator protein